MNQAEKARHFTGLHRPGKPLVLFNIWDAGSAKALAGANAAAVATGSWSVAAAHGYADGQKIPLPLLLQIVSRITATVELPVSVDFEGGYAIGPEEVAGNVAQLLDTGAIGLNFEDQVVGGEGLHAIDLQSARIKAMRQVAHAAGIPLFINARTDLFLQEPNLKNHGTLLPLAIERAAAYRDAGANGYFVPGLTDEALIGRLCKAVDLPVNIMFRGDCPEPAALASLGVARISHGPGPYLAAMNDLAVSFKSL